MPTNIRQIEDAKTSKTILRVEGEMTRTDAELLETIALEIRGETEKNLTIDLADLHFLDSDGATVLRRMADKHEFEIEGLLIFLQRVIEENEKRNSNLNQK